MRRAMASLRIEDPDRLGQAVREAGDARDVVLAELTVGETYFFREEAQLGLLRSVVLPQLSSRCGADRPLRIWSAGCATGEEPYTIAILLREERWPHPARILGTDVSQPRLAAARRGRYTRWSLRGVSDARVARWFAPRAAQVELDPAIRGAVDFRIVNLMGSDYPSAATGTSGQDVVLCRNVLIYFDMPAVAQIATRLLAALAPEGWLLLGASDPPLADLVPCEVVMTPSGMAYRRADRPAGTGTGRRAAHHGSGRAWHRTDVAPREPMLATDELQSISPSLPPSLPQVLPESRPTAADALPVDAHGIEPVATAQADDLSVAREDREASRRGSATDDPQLLASVTLMVRSLADQGRLREADEQCMRALDQHRMSPELHYLHAMLLGAAGQWGEAANAARRAVYLDRSFVMGHLQLGDALARLDRGSGARRAFENALRALADRNESDAIPAADGVPVSHLRRHAELRLRALGGGTRP